MKRRTRIDKDTNKINEFEYFKAYFVVFELTFLISVEIYSFLKHDIYE